jgi:hypothetical protein
MPTIILGVGRSRTSWTGASIRSPAASVSYGRGGVTHVYRRRAVGSMPVGAAAIGVPEIEAHSAPDGAFTVATPTRERFALDFSNRNALACAPTFIETLAGMGA